MKASLKWVVLTGVLMLFTPSLIHADGCYFSTESIAVSSDQRAIIIINGNEISMTFSTAYTGNSADFGWVIPTPVTPDPADIRETGADAEALFEYLGELTAPILETETGSGCFPSGTMVLTESGARPIESLHEGDTVWAYDTDAREWSLSQITIHRSYRYNGDMIAIQAGDVLLDATGNHQFMTVSSGSISWVEARNLLPGDRLLSKNIGIIDIIEVRSRNVRSEVYHLEVEPHHSYAVHEAGFVVHNGGKQDEGIATEAAPLVTVYGTVSLESYEVSILGAAGGEALLLWLSDNGYRVDASASDVLDAYANEGWTFVAVKMHPGERRYDNEFLPAVTIIYNYDRIIFPMRISSVSTNARVAVTLYVVADS
ncbi:MAG: DUF2330 domain-containing protein, partial [Spirochaetaceae bacterium]|nr:DUF2330 domain-containing protein [Spirochaetaceae bacterium]